MSKKKVTAPLTYNPGKGRPKEHLAYLNWQEMQELQRINGGNVERGPGGLPSFPPKGAMSGNSARSPAATSKSKGAGSKSTGGGMRSGPGATGGGKTPARASSYGRTVESSRGVGTQKSAPQKAGMNARDAQFKQVAESTRASSALKKSAAAGPDLSKSGIKTLNVGPMGSPVNVKTGQAKSQIKGAIKGVASQSYVPKPVPKPPSGPQYNYSKPSDSILSEQQIRDKIRAEALARGIDPNVAILVAEKEGLYAKPEEGYQSFVKKAGKREESFGPYQLYTGGGLGNEFQKVTGLDPRDPKTVPAQVEFALDKAAAGGWGPWSGSRAAGLKSRSGLEGAKPLYGPAQPASNESLRARSIGGIKSLNIPHSKPKDQDRIVSSKKTQDRLESINGETVMREKNRFTRKSDAPPYALSEKILSVENVPAAAEDDRDRRNRGFSLIGTAEAAEPPAGFSRYVGASVPYRPYDVRAPLPNQRVATQSLAMMNPTIGETTATEGRGYIGPSGKEREEIDRMYNAYMSGESPTKTSPGGVSGDASGIRSLEPGDTYGPKFVDPAIQEEMRKQDKLNRAGIRVAKAVTGPVGRAFSVADTLRKVFTGKTTAEATADLKRAYMQASSAQRAELEKTYPNLTKFAADAGIEPQLPMSNYTDWSRANRLAETSGRGDGREQGMGGIADITSTAGTGATPSATPSTASTASARPYIYYEWDLGINVPSPGDPKYTDYQKYLQERADAQKALGLV